MADLDSLNYESISEMSVDEALEHLRQIRLSRRIPDKPKKKSTKKSTSLRQPKKQPAPNINALDLNQVEALLKSLGGK